MWFQSKKRRERVPCGYHAVSELWVKEWCVCRGSVPVKKGDRGGTEVFAKITCEEEEKRWFENGVQVANKERRLISEIKRRGEVERRKEEKRGVE